MEKLLQAEKVLKKLALRETKGDKRKCLKSKLNKLLSECYNEKIDIEYLTIKYDFIQEINVYKNNEGTASVVVVYKNNYKFKEVF